VEKIMTVDGSRKRLKPTATTEEYRTAKRVKSGQPATNGSKGEKKSKGTKAEPDQSDSDFGSDVNIPSTPAKQKRGKKAKSSAKASITDMILATRTLNVKLLIGAHVSAAGGSPTSTYDY
jgi:hypothetical protein